MLMRQYLLKSDHIELITWLPADPPLSNGQRLTLKGYHRDIIWVVDKRYKLVIDSSKIHRDWHNNI